MAIRIAKLLGAGRVVAAGRDLEPLTALTTVGADQIVQLTDDALATAKALPDAAADCRHRHRLPKGQAGTARDHGTAHRSVGPQPPAELDPDRPDRRSDDRAAFDRAALSGPSIPRQPSRAVSTQGISPDCHPSSSDQRRHDRAQSNSEGTRRRRDDLGPAPTGQASAPCSCRKARGRPSNTPAVPNHHASRNHYKAGRGRGQGSRPRRVGVAPRACATPGLPATTLPHVGRCRDLR